MARPVDEVVDSGKITIFVYSDYAPYSWEDDNGAHGIDVERVHGSKSTMLTEPGFAIRL